MYKVTNQMLGDLNETNELNSTFNDTAHTIMEDIKATIKYHRQRTYATLLHNDLVVIDEVQRGTHQYNIVMSDNSSNDKVEFTSRDTLVQLSSFDECKVQLDKVSRKYYNESTQVLLTVRETLVKLQELYRLMGNIIRQFPQRADLVAPFKAVSSNFAQTYKSFTSHQRSQSHQR